MKNLIKEIEVMKSNQIEIIELKNKITEKAHMECFTLERWQRIESVSLKLDKQNLQSSREKIGIKSENKSQGLWRTVIKEVTFITLEDDTLERKTENGIENVIWKIKV